MAANISTGDPSAKILAADELAAIYDLDSKLLYLYAKGPYKTPTLTYFSRQPWIGALKFAFEGLYVDDDKDKAEAENHFAEKFLIGIPKGSDSVLIVVAGEEPGTEAQVKVVKIAFVPLLQ